MQNRYAGLSAGKQTLLSPEEIIELARTIPHSFREISGAIVHLAESGRSEEQIRQTIDDWAKRAELEQQTLSGRFRGLREAWLELVLKLTYSLGIHRICSWLAHMIRRLTPGE